MPRSGHRLVNLTVPLHQLNIDIICANAPQAKGRVERANGTLQDRLVKELRLAGVSTMEAGNAFLPTVMADFNRRFAKAPYSNKDLHRLLSEHDDLDDVFAWREERTVSRSVTLQYDQVLFILEPNEITLALARQRVQVYDYPDGRFAIKHKGLELPYRIFDRRQRVDQAREAGSARGCPKEKGRCVQRPKVGVLALTQPCRAAKVTALGTDPPRHRCWCEA